jgi:Transketolase, C-terminal subunit
MGISKAKGIAIAKKLLNRKGHIFVMTGDGELQEGQNYEALQTAIHQNVTNITVIVDHNKVQTDKPVRDIIDLGDLESKFKSFGWHVARCDGHDFEQIINSFCTLGKVKDAPKVLIADTIKGKGISFMEHPTDLETNKGIYRWHSGAPDDSSFKRGHEELVTRINCTLNSKGIKKLNLKTILPEEKLPSAVTEEYVADAFGSSLIRIAQKRKDMIVLDADLAGDCRIRNFELQYPDQFIENGIAEQDMVSTAGGLALQGLLPVVNTFGAFLSARANEQIYNNACEKTKIIYVNHYSGLIPAGPGQSHQSIRDISLLGNLPNIEILQPCNAAETEMIVDYCVNETNNNCVIRLVIGPSPQKIILPPEYRIKKGCGVTLKDGNDAVLISYGPVMLKEAIHASQLLEMEEISLEIINMPWLNQVDKQWVKEKIGTNKPVFILEDHNSEGGLGDHFLHTLALNGWVNNRIFQIFGVTGFPAWGRPPEVLKYHKLDSTSIAARIQTILGGRNCA